VRVNAGAKKIAAAYEGKNVDKSIKVAAAEAATVDLEVAKDPPPAPVAEPVAEAPVPPKPPPPKRSTPIVPWAITGVLAAGTIVSGVLAYTSYSSYQDKREEFPVKRAELDEAQGTARTYFVLTGILGAATVLSAGVAGYFTIASGGTPKDKPVALALGPGGVAIHGVLP
jgi:hypothetical protein